MAKQPEIFTQDELEAIAKALGDTSEGLTGSEISHILPLAKLRDIDPAATKWKRIHNAFVDYQNQKRNRAAILAFIRKAIKPTRYRGRQDHFESMRHNLNGALSFCGLSVQEDGDLVPVKQAKTLTESEQRADALRASLKRRDVHPDVLEYCNAELLTDNFFHAVLEATKSVAEKIREKTGLTDDGATMADRALGGSPPMLAINPLQTESERSAQSGFLNLVKGVFGMFRNPTAHEAKINWNMVRADAEDLLSTLSLIHRRLDASHMPSRV